MLTGTPWFLTTSFQKEEDEKREKMVLRESINHHKDPVDAAFMQKKT